jgi:hypothetical protein
MCSDDGWKYHPKHVEQFPDINKLCNVSCWIYIGILLAHPVVHISRIRVKRYPVPKDQNFTALYCSTVYNSAGRKRLQCRTELCDRRSWGDVGEV